MAKPIALDLTAFQPRAAEKILRLLTVLDAVRSDSLTPRRSRGQAPRPCRRGRLRPRASLRRLPGHSGRRPGRSVRGLEDAELGQDSVAALPENGAHQLAVLPPASIPGPRTAVGCGLSAASFANNGQAVGSLADRLEARQRCRYSLTFAKR
jgi:hypothetical protein